ALDARLGTGGGALPAWPAPGAEPRGLPTDGPTELEAKADILNDQARRLAARSDVLLARAHDLRARQALSKRVGQMERDPFAALDSPKRRAMTSATAPASSQTPRSPTTTTGEGASPTLGPTGGGTAS